MGEHYISLVLLDFEEYSNLYQSKTNEVVLQSLSSHVFSVNKIGFSGLQSL